MKQMKVLLMILGVLMFTFGMVSIAAAIPVTATVTADNHYAIYYGTPGDVTFVGANESDWNGAPGTYIGLWLRRGSLRLKLVTISILPPGEMTLSPRD